MRAELRKFLQHEVIDLIIDHHRLLGGANRPVIEGLGRNNVYYGHIQVGRFFQIDWRIAGPYTERRFARAVGGSDDTTPAGSINQADVFVVHQVGVVRERWRFHAGKDALGRAVLQRRLVHDSDGLLATSPGFWMRTENDRVPRLDGHDAFEQNRGSGIGNRRERENDPDRFSRLYQAAFRELANRANGTFVFDIVVDELGGHHVLNSLIFQNPDSGFLNGQASQVLSLFHAGRDHRFDNAIDILLGILRKHRGGGSGLTD